MGAAKNKFNTVSDYIDNQPADVRKTLLALRAIILKAAPQATELMNYDIAAFALAQGGKRDKQVMMAGYKNFVGFYTGTGVLEHFSAKLKGYTVGKASVQFPTSKRLPIGLITSIVKYKQLLISLDRERPTRLSARDAQWLCKLLDGSPRPPNAKLQRALKDYATWRGQSSERTSRK